MAKNPAVTIIWHRTKTVPSLSPTNGIQVAGDSSLRWTCYKAVSCIRIRVKQLQLSKDTQKPSIHSPLAKCLSMSCCCMPKWQVHHHSNSIHGQTAVFVSQTMGKDMSTFGLLWFSCQTGILRKVCPATLPSWSLAQWLLRLLLSEIWQTSSSLKGS